MGRASRSGGFLKQRIATFAFRVSLVLAVPAVLLDGLFLLNSFNPLTLAFLTSFQLRNDSSENLRVWFAGTGETGRLGLLPLYASSKPALPALRSGGFRLAPGATRTITYDWDDRNFDLILVEGPDAELRALPVDADHPKQGCCWQHRRELYAIPVLRELRVATAEEREVAGRYRSAWLFMAPWLVIPFASAYLYRVQRRLHAPRSTEQS